MKEGTESSALDDGELLGEYNFSGGVRGKYAGAYVAGSNVVVLAPDVASVFPDSKAVNEALRALVNIARRATTDSAT